MSTPSSRRLDGPVARAKQAIIPSVAPAPVAVAAAPIFEYEKSPKPTGSQGPKKWWKGWTKWAIIATLAVVLAVSGYLGIHVLLATRHIITRHTGAEAAALSDKVNVSDLKTEGDGRVNILLLGIGGEGHDGPLLSDTIMLMSIDTVNKQAAMLSIPRDLYVKIPGYGYSKINQANSDGGPKLAEQVVQTVTGMTVQYYAQVDFSGFQQAVDAVGGVTIAVPHALYDGNYPCSDGVHFCPYYQAAGMIQMNGATALKYARCRHDDCANDTGRAARQQQVIIAIRDRALQASTLTNPIKIANLIDAVGDHVKTDLQLSQIQKLASIAADINSANITSDVLNFDGTGPSNLLTTTQNAAGDVLVPLAGTFNYHDIQNFAKSIFPDPYLTKENAMVQVENGSGIAGLAGQVVTDLKAAHYNVGDPVNAPQTQSQTVIYDYSKGKYPYTVNYLENRFGVTAIQQNPPASPDGSTPPQIRIILGSDYQSSATNK